MMKIIKIKNCIQYIKKITIGKINQDIWNKSLIHYSEIGDLQGVQHALKNGANIHADSDFAFFVACTKGHINVVQYLHEHGIKINRIHEPLNDQSLVEKSLQYTAEKGHLEVVKYLVSKGADIQKEDCLALRLAIHNNHIKIATYFLLDCDIKLTEIIENYLILGNQEEILRLIEKRNLKKQLEDSLEKKVIHKKHKI